MLRNVVVFINDNWLDWLFWLISFINNLYDLRRILLIAAIISFVLMVAFGIFWENSGPTAEERKKLLDVFSKIFFAVFVVTAALFFLSTAIHYILIRLSSG